jgi:hypothetical protein
MYEHTIHIRAACYACFETTYDHAPIDLHIRYRDGMIIHRHGSTPVAELRVRRYDRAPRVPGRLFDLPECIVRFDKAPARSKQPDEMIRERRNGVELRLVHEGSDPSDGGEEAYPVPVLTSGEEGIHGISGYGHKARLHGMKSSIHRQLHMTREI